MAVLKFPPEMADSRPATHAFAIVVTSGSLGYLAWNYTATHSLSKNNHNACGNTQTVARYGSPWHNGQGVGPLMSIIQRLWGQVPR
eukprot:689898-Amphidinium_carterae.2